MSVYPRDTRASRGKNNKKDYTVYCTYNVTLRRFRETIAVVEKK